MAYNFSAGDIYLRDNPDVMSWARDQVQAQGIGAGPDYRSAMQGFAQQHYNDFGQTEGRVWGTPQTATVNSDDTGPNTTTWQDTPSQATPQPVGVNDRPSWMSQPPSWYGQAPHWMQQPLQSGWTGMPSWGLGLGMSGLLGPAPGWGGLLGGGVSGGGWGDPYQFQGQFHGGSTMPHAFGGEPPRYGTVQDTRYTGSRTPRPYDASPMAANSGHTMLWSY